MRRQDVPGDSTPPGATGDPPVVFVVDDDISVRESLELLVLAAGWQPFTFASAEEFLGRPHCPGPSCLVLDVGLPDLNGLEVQQRILDRVDMPVIFVTGQGDIPTSVRAMKAGALEFLTKPYSDDVLLEAIGQALGRSQETLVTAANLASLQECYASLTPRQGEIMALVVAGLLNKQIAVKLGISEVTVKAHRGQVMRKMHADSLAQLVKTAGVLGISVNDTKVSETKV